MLLGALGFLNCVHALVLVSIIYSLNSFNKVAPYPVVTSYLEVKGLYYLMHELQLQWLWLNPSELKQPLSIHVLYPPSHMEVMLCVAVVQSSDCTQKERMVSGTNKALAWLTIPFGMATQ